MRIRLALIPTGLFLFAMFPVRTAAQITVTTGIPPFGSFSGGPDVINNANLNVHYTIPVFQKTGRGTNFSYSLAYDSSIWEPRSSNGTTVWQPLPTWGWAAGLAAGGSRYVLYSITYSGEILCGPNNEYQYSEYTFSNFIYYDSLGTPHSFNGSASYIAATGTTGCPASGSSDPNGMTVQADAYTMTLGPAGPGYINLTSLVDAGGNQLNVPFLTSPPGSTGSSKITDRNGNFISSSNGVYTDTLNTTALTVTNGGTTTLSYPTPAGGTAQYTVTYQTYTVRTNFGCSGISEFGPTNESLVSKISLPDGTYYQFTYESTPYYSSDVTGRVASVQLPTGGTISYTYEGGSNGIECFDGSTAGFNRSTPDTGSGYWSYTRTLGGGGYGTNTTTITDPQGGQTVLDFSAIYELWRQVSQNSSTLATVTTCYNGNTANCSSATVSTPITERAVTTQLGGSNNLEAETDTFYNGYDLVTELDEYDYGQGGRGSLIRQTQTSYANLGNDIFDMPGTVTVKEGGNTLAQTIYSYDQNPLTSSGSPQLAQVSGSRGNATTIQYLVSGSTYLQKQFTYYDNGNVNVATDVNNATTTYNYGGASCGSSFPTSVSEPLGLTKSMTWNCNGGVQTANDDENGNSVAYNYTDAQFWRPNSMTDQMSNTTNLSYTGQTSVESSQLFNSDSSTSDVLSTLDDLGRPHIIQKRQSPSGSYDSVETEYDPSGRPSFTTLPYSASGGDACSGNCAGTTTQFDALGRPLSVTDTSGLEIDYSYPANDVLETVNAPSGENSKKKQYEYDALGRLTSVCEITNGTGSGNCPQTNTGKTGYFTQYMYDALGDLTKVIQGGEIRQYAYDGLGRMTSETNPESGTTTYTYDSDSTCGTYKGDLAKKVDQATNTTCYAYDALHRITTITVPSGPNSGNTPSKYFVYDSPCCGWNLTNTKGRLWGAHTCFAPCSSLVTDEAFSFDARGEVTDAYEATPHSGAYYHASATYWPNGALKQLTDAGGYYMTYSVDGEGRVYSGTDGGGGMPLSSATYNAAGQPTTASFGPSGNDTYSYDQNSGRMTQYSFNVSGEPSDVGALVWNANGTLENLAISDPFNAGDNQACAYTHDDLSRISSAECYGNAMSNPGLESGNTGWSLGSGYSIVNDPANAHSGNWYLSVSGQTGDSWAVANGTNGSNWIAVSPGQVITVGGWIKRTGGTGSLDYSCEIVDSNHNLVQWCNGAILGDGSGGTSWGYYSGETTVPSNGAFIQVYAEVHCCGEGNNSATSGDFDDAFVDGASVWSQTFSYDAFGNIAKNGTESFQPGYSSNPPTNQMTSVGSCTPLYDADGNVEYDCLNSYTWDAYGRPTKIAGVSVTYDAFGRMVEQNSNGAYTQFLYSPSGFKMTVYNAQTTVKHLVPLAAGAMAIYGPSGPPYIRQADWLGSSRLAYGVYDGAYGPFGEPYAQQGTPDLSFTGMGQDTASNVYDFPAREYGIQGRWESPDPAGLAAVNPMDPQTWNRYAYVRNSPLSFIDPLGLDDCVANAARPRWPRAADEFDDSGCGDDGGGDSGYGGAIIDLGPGDYTVTVYADAPEPVLLIPYGYGSGGGGSISAPAINGGMVSLALNRTTTCAGAATVSAVGTGPHQAPYTGHTGSLYPPIAGGAMGTVAVQNNFLGIGRAGLRRYGTQIFVTFADGGAIAASGGPSGPYTVSDRGDINIQNDPSVRFDLYRWDSTYDALQFGIQHYTGTVTFPTASGGTCPAGWTVP
jgi:RHS repeat-associated protein